MNQQINIKKLSNHYHFPVATESADQISKQLDNKLKQYLIQSLERNIQNKLQSLGYAPDCLIAIRRINISLTINNYNDITTASGLSNIVNKWVEAVANGFLRILTSIPQNTASNESVYNDLIAVFPDQTRAEIVYLEHLASQLTLPWWAKSLLIENDTIQSAPIIIENWLLSTPTQGSVLLTDLTHTVGYRWLELLNDEHIAQLLHKLIEYENINPLAVDLERDQQDVLTNNSRITKSIELTQKEMNWLKAVDTFEHLVFLAAIFIRSKQNEFSHSVTYQELLSIIHTNIPELDKHHKELRYCISASTQEADNSNTVEKLSDSHITNDNLVTDNNNNAIQKTDKQTSKTTLNKSSETAASELRQQKSKSHTKNKNESKPKPISSPTEDNKTTETRRLKEKKQPSIVPQSYPTGCSGLLFLIRQAVRLLPDAIYSEANVNIMYALAILCLQDLISLLPEARQRAAWKRETYLIQAFSGLKELADSSEPNDLDNIEQKYLNEAQSLLDQLSLHISDQINPGKNGIAYFFTEQGPHELTPLQNMLLRPGRLLVNDVYITLQMPISDIDIALRKQGWDIDPGWTPQINRVIRFEYRE